MTLMKSRYSAYVTGEISYIIQTTHPDNSDYIEDTKRWEEDIALFCKNTDFFKLTILEFMDGEEEAYVTFSSLLSSGALKEKSRFLKEYGKWLYVDGEFS